MASKSSPPKNASTVSIEHARALLHDGACHNAPSDDLLRAADHLAALGVIRSRRQQYVLCANRKDGDFERRPNRNCDGEVDLVDGLDENEDAFACPICDRPVYPHGDSKEQFSKLTIELLDAGAEALVAAMAAEAFGQQNVHQLDSGVYRIDADGDEVTLILVDTMGRRYNKLQSLGERRYLLVLADMNTPQSRLPAETWLAWVTLAELIAETRDLANCVKETIRDDQPRVVTSSIPIFSANRPIVAEPSPGPRNGRRFIVELREKTVLVEGVVVVKPQAGPRYDIFVKLWQQFLEDLGKGRVAEDFTRIGIKAIMKALDQDNEGNARRVVNNLQNTITDQVRKQLGLPIDREDVVQTCKMKDQRDTAAGYRINPLTVVIRPRQT